MAHVGFKTLFIALAMSIFSTVGFTAPNESVANHLVQQAAANTAQSADGYVQELSILLDAVQKYYKVSEISIGGGTARALIRHVMLGTEFTFRDFDIVFFANQKVTAENSKALGLYLEKQGLGKFSEENLRPRPRYNPSLQEPDASKYNAGFGFFVISKQDIEFDISIFHSINDLDLNGILDVDKLQVRINKDNIKTLFKNKNEFLASIADPAGGLESVLKGGVPKVSNWAAVAADPTNTVIRIVRGLSKFNALPVDEIASKKISAILENDKNGNPLQMSRNLLKLLEDPTWKAEFTSLVSLGLFSQQFKSFQSAYTNQTFLKSRNINERVLGLLESASTADALNFLKLLSDLEPELIKSVLPKLIVKKGLKVGYFTGEFAPFHKGHFGVAQTALDKGGLDLVFVIPTPHATNDPKTVKYSKLEWEERRTFAKAGTKKDSRIWLWPSVIDTSNKPTLVDQINSLEKFLNLKTPLTHIFGMDSFHRVLNRNLLETSTRPRIAVTRPGVPIPDGQFGNAVQVLENVANEPVSATRILHQIAMTGTSDDVSPEVVKAVKQTKRYQKILTELVEAKTNAEAAIAPVGDIKTKTLIWDPRENHAGLYESEFPKMNQTHEQVIDRLEELGATELIVFTEDNRAPETKSWRKFAKSYSGNLEILVQEYYGNIPDTSRVMVVHSGVANENMKSGHFVERYRGTKGLIIYETADQPLSPLVKAMSTITVVNAMGLSCKDLFNAVGF